MRFCGHCGAARVAGEEGALAADPSGFVMERRLVTVLFADLSGFTSLSEQLEPDELAEIIDPIIAALGDLVGAYGGFIDKYAGDAVLALFGAPVAHDEDALRAVLCARDMHRELGRVGPLLQEVARGLTLHVGVNTGRVIARPFGSDARVDYGVIGDAVNTAQRLEAAAGPGETLVGELTWKLTREHVDYEALGPLTVKGKAAGVPSWRVVGTARRGTSSRQVAATAVLGRDTELAQLEEAINRLKAGEGGVLVISGEPGVGKSRLLEEMERCAAGGARWLGARCLSYGASLPYWPYADLLRGTDADVDRGGVASDLDHHRQVLQRLIGVRSSQEPGASSTTASGFAGLEPAAARRQIRNAFRWWLSGLAADTSVVLAIEDVHWADPSSLALTSDLVEGAADLPVLFVLTTRSDDLQAAHEIGALHPGACVEIALGPLDDATVESLLVELLGSVAPREMRALAGRVDGNPFFLQELVWSLQDLGHLVEYGTGWRLAPGWSPEVLPLTVEAALSARLDCLARATAGVLSVAAVIGRQVRLPLLRAALRDHEVDSHVQRLLDLGLLVGAEPGDDAVAFRHALVAEVAYERVPRRRKVELHRLIAEQAIGLYGSGDDVVDLLARHCYLGELGAAAVPILWRAGQRARALHANDEAGIHFQRLVDVSQSTQQTQTLGDALLALGEVQELVGHYENAHETFKRAYEQTSSPAAARGLAATTWKLGDSRAALDLLHEAVTVAPAGSAELWLLESRIASTEGRAAEARSACLSGLEAASDDPVLIGRLLTRLARLDQIEGDNPASLAHAERACKLLEGPGSLAYLASALRVLGGSYFDAGRLTEATAALRAGLTAAERAGSADELIGCLIDLGMTAMEEGDVSRAVVSYRQAVAEVNRSKDRSGLPLALANLAEALAAADDIAEAEDLCTEAITLAKEFRQVPVQADGLITLATLWLRQGRTDQAADVAYEAAQLAKSCGDSAILERALALASRASSMSDAECESVPSKTGRGVDGELEAPG
jgi:class 3 adenylate cyclase/tetratricopeptide (TPR) repeat protein